MNWKKTIANSSAEIGKLNARIVELEKYKSAITKLESENAEFRVRFTKLEQDHNEQTQGQEEAIPEVLPEIPDREMDVFLNEVHKKKVSDEIKQRNREKKLMREKANKEAPPISQNPTSTSCNERKKWTGVDSRNIFIHRTRGIESHDQNFDRKSDTISSDALALGTSMIEISHHLAQLRDKALIAEECTLEANQEEIFCWHHYGRNFVFQEKALCDKDKIGEKKAKGLIYDEAVKKLNIFRKKRSQDTGSPLPDISRDSLRKKTQRAVKIYKLFEKVGIDKVKY